MIRLDADKPLRLCDGLSRRDFLHAGSLGMLGFSLANFERFKAEGAIPEDQDLNVIQLFLVGGPSQLDTWDMKPTAPAEIRGPYRPIKTNVPGIEICEIFPRMARIADKYSLVRSLHHTAAAVHAAGCQLMQTGRLFQRGERAPHFGSVLAWKKGPRAAVPPQVLLPRPIANTGSDLSHGQGAGFLGKAYDPLVAAVDPSASESSVPDGPSPDHITSLRPDRHRDWLALVDRSVSNFESTFHAKLDNTGFHQAFSLMSSSRARRAFELKQEPDAVRECYGQNRFGQSCLLARRLVEAGVRYVTVNMFETVFNEISWDTHGYRPFSPTTALRDLGQMFDSAFSSLLIDLHQRGLLEKTLVMATGEFGRTPTINHAGGRDHWPACWTAVFAGGGVQGGQVVGASDGVGGTPRDRPVTPQEVAATVYHLMGFEPETFLPAEPGRLVALVENGAEPIRELLI